MITTARTESPSRLSFCDACSCVCARRARTARNALLETAANRGPRL